MQKMPTISSLLIVTLFSFLPILCRAGIIAQSHPVFGTDALTTDTEQGLSFLDLTFSLGFSYNQVTSEFNVGGQFEGFRYATELEVGTLVNNYGFSPTWESGSVSGNTGSDQLSGLVTLLGVTGFDTTMQTRLTSGITGTWVSPIRLRTAFIADQIAFNTNDEFSANNVIPPEGSGTALGSFLVQTSVPEPNSLVLCMLLSGFCLFPRKKI